MNEVTCLRVVAAHVVLQALLIVLAAQPHHLRGGAAASVGLTFSRSVHNRMALLLLSMPTLADITA